MGAARTVRRGDLVPLDGDLGVRHAVEQVVDRVVAVAAGDERSGRAELDEPLRQLAARPVPRR